MPATTIERAQQAWDRLREAAPFMRGSTCRERPIIKAEIELGRWVVVAAEVDGEVEHDAIGKVKWTVSIPVRTEDEAVALAAALGGVYGYLASHRYPDCRYVVNVEREAPRGSEIRVG